MVPRHSPKPMDAKPSRRQCARMITVSPSSRNRRLSPDGSVDRLTAAGGDFEQAAEAVGGGAGNCTGAEDVARLAGCSRRWCDGRQAGSPSSRGRARCRPTADAAGSAFRLHRRREQQRPQARCRARHRPGRPSRADRAGAPDRPRAVAPAPCGTAPMLPVSPPRARRWCRSSCRETGRAAGIPSPGYRAPTSR